MLDDYYSIGGKAIRADGRTLVKATRATLCRPKAFAKAFGFGLGAALAGAVVYYAGIALAGSRDRYRRDPHWVDGRSRDPEGVAGRRLEDDIRCWRRS